MVRERPVGTGQAELTRLCQLAAVQHSQASAETLVAGRPTRRTPLATEPVQVVLVLSQVRAVTATLLAMVGRDRIARLHPLLRHQFRLNTVAVVAAAPTMGRRPPRLVVAAVGL